MSAANTRWKLIKSLNIIFLSQQNSTSTRVGSDNFKKNLKATKKGWNREREGMVKRVGMAQRFGTEKRMGMEKRLDDGKNDGVGKRVGAGKECGDG